MSLQPALAEIERARADLDRVRAATTGWHDPARQKFDAQRLDPLAAATKQIAAAMTRADQEISKALRHLGV